MWLAAALSAIAFTLANSVRTETQRASTASDGLRAYYLASGACQRALLYMTWGPGPRNLDGTPRYWEDTWPYLRMNFPTGEALVEVVPETSRLNINTCRPEQILNLLLVLGVRPDQASAITAAILDWRAAPPAGQVSEFDAFYLARPSSFRARHASLEETEELLFVKGMTPEIYYGTYERDAEGRLLPRPGLKDCVSVWALPGAVDVNTAHPALLQSLGFTPEMIAAVVQRRRLRPYRSAQDLGPLMDAAGPGARNILRTGGNSIYTLRSTARLRLPDGRLSDLSRSVAMTVQLHTSGAFTEPYDILRWYDNAPVAEGLGR
jgi:general secretion pathway protein K